MSNRMNNLSESINDYIDYWRKSLEALDSVYPSNQRSQEFKRLTNGLKNLIGTYSIPENNSDYQPGNVSAAFNPYLKNLATRLLPLDRGIETEETKFLGECFTNDDKESAAKLLRLIHMIEHESCNLHYAIISQNWMSTEDVRIASYIDTKTLCLTQMEQVKRKIDDLDAARAITEKLFFKDWNYIRKPETLNRIGEIKQALQLSFSAVERCLADEKNADKPVAELRADMLKFIEDYQSRLNEILDSKDRNKLMDLSEAQEKEWSLINIFESPKTPSGLEKQKVMTFQRSEKYESVNKYIEESIGKLGFHYREQIGLQDTFLRREKSREEAKAQVIGWKKVAFKAIDDLFNQKEALTRATRLYSADINDERKIANSGQDSLSYAFEMLFTAQASSLSDGNWDELSELSQQKLPQSCLKRENIAAFRKSLLAYKSQTSTRRTAFSRINKALLITMAVIGGFFTLKWFLTILPTSLQSSQFVTAISAALHMPMAVAIGLPIIIVALIVLNIGNARKIRDDFEVNLDGYESGKEYEIDDHEPQTTYGKMIDYVTRVFGYTPKAKHEPIDESIYEEGTFIGSEHQKDETDTISQKGSSSPGTIDYRETRSESGDSMVSVDLENEGGSPRSPGGSF